MIRRDATGPDGQAGWMLISQVEHARLSGLLAEHWGGARVAAVRPRDEIVAAVYHHDDGWAGWFDRPGVDRTTGRPRNFTEMKLDDALGIWRRSIRAAREAGPLAGYMVSGHFAYLLRGADAWGTADAAWRSAAETFLAEQDRQQRDWLPTWRQQAPATNTIERAEQALAYLQMFDNLSLWMCCAERHEPYTVSTPLDETLTLDPAPNGRILLSPWPLSVPELAVALDARLVPARQYGDEAELAAAMSGQATLRLLLLPSPRG